MALQIVSHALQHSTRPLQKSPPFPSLQRASFVVVVVVFFFVRFRIVAAAAATASRCMSISSEHSDSGCSFAGRSPARPLEKSSFSHTCSLLSQYLKEKGSFGDLSLGMSPPAADATGAPGMSRRAATTMNLFPICEGGDAESRNVKFMDLFPQQAGFGSTKEDVSKTNNSCSNKKEPETAQMTIFYAGQVIVLNDFPADKAKEVMLAASKASSVSQHVAAAPNLAKSKPAFAPNYAKNPVESGGVVSSSPIPVPALGANAIQEHIRRPTEPLAYLPIARRASLHRFLEKRKDRLTARAPYITASSGSAAAPPPKPAETNPWLGLAAQPTR
ncbi:protein TIFY 10A isoform X2 [Syzygium oleosum]|uniref:protein TIFY 10A isoform X2 n=1 Tax=Syzygium oleosum TaxID=219896 RepID=UPI0024B8B050|nr:protein TIFY 10A isoform X2 [Syzygium oleosum]